MNPKPELLKRINAIILWLPMIFMSLAAGLKYITWNTFCWYLLSVAIYFSLLVTIATCIEVAMSRSLKSSKTGLYHKFMFRYFQWKLLNFCVPQHDLRIPICGVCYI